MTTSFIFIYDGMSYQYGIGKYIACLKEGIAGKDDITLNIIVLGSKDCTEMTITAESANINTIHFPIFPGNHIEQEHIKNAEQTIDSLEAHFAMGNRVIFHFVVWCGIFLAMVLKKRYHNPIIFDLHSLEWQFALNGNKQKFEPYWHRTVKDCETNYKDRFKPGVLYEKQLCDLSDHIIVRTNQMKRDVIETYKTDENKISVVYNGIATKEPSIHAKEEAKVKLGFRGDERIILFAGRVCDQKGILFLIKAFKIVLSEIKDIRLVIAGNGYFDNYLKECDNFWSKVTFTGWLDAEKLDTLYKIADIGVVPSLFEPFGYVILEMMQHHIPVISTNIEGPNEIIEDGYSGIKVNIMQSDDGKRSILPEELAEKIKLLLNHKLFAKSLTENAFSKLKKQFSSIKMAKNIVEVYQTVTL